MRPTKVTVTSSFLPPLVFRYQFTTGSKFAIFTFQGCTVQVSGKMEVEPYTRWELGAP